MTKGKTGKKEDCIMKKVFYLIGAFLMLAACSKNAVTDQPAIPDHPAEDAAGFKVSLTISRADAFGSESESRATVKNEWADGDVVFVFFQGVAAPKYLEMKYSSGKWVATFKNDLSVSALGTSGTMTAVFLPYGSCSTVSADDRGNFKFDPMYQGVYLQTEQVAYTCNSGELSGKLTLAAPQLDEGGKYIHFDVSGYDAAHAYTLYQDYVGAVCFIGVMSNGIVPINIGTPGGAIPGYADADKNILSFSGVLDASAVGKAVDYQFSINDAAASVLYTRDAGTKTLTSSKYIGLGSISSSTWNATEYVDLGITSDGVRLLWATRNLGATADTGEGSWGNYFAWASTTGYPLTGTFPNYSSSHAFNTIPTYECYGDAYPLSNPQYFYYLPQYDPAHATLGGLWRTPSPQEFQKLKDATDRQFSYGDLGHEYVDMGNGLGWAMENVGTDENYPYGVLTNYPSSSDPATDAWGAPWRTPRQDEWDNLTGTQTFTQTPGTLEGATGWWFARTDDPTIAFFLHSKPGGAAIIYWSSTKYSNGKMYCARIDDEGKHVVRQDPSQSAYVRPVVSLSRGTALAGVTISGKNEYADKSIFLPAAGYIDGNNPKDQGLFVYYWTCEKYPSDITDTALRVKLTNDPGSWAGFDTGSAEFIRCGLPVRPVFTLPAPEDNQVDFKPNEGMNAGNEFQGLDQYITPSDPDPFDF